VQRELECAAEDIRVLLVVILKVRKVKGSKGSPEKIRSYQNRERIPNKYHQHLEFCSVN